MTRRDLPGLSFAGPTILRADPTKRHVVVLMLDGFGLWNITTKWACRR